MARREQAPQPDEQKGRPEDYMSEADRNRYIADYQAKKEAKKSEDDTTANGQEGGQTSQTDDTGGGFFANLFRKKQPKVPLDESGRPREDGGDVTLPDAQARKDAGETPPFYPKTTKEWQDELNKASKEIGGSPFDNLW